MSGEHGGGRRGPKPRGSMVLLPPSSLVASGASALAAAGAIIAWSLRNGIHSMSAAIGSFNSPSRTITIHSDMVSAMLLLPGAIV